jgi:hypothetical protein
VPADFGGRAQQFHGIGIDPHPSHPQVDGGDVVRSPVCEGRPARSRLGAQARELAGVELHATRREAERGRRDDEVAAAIGEHQSGLSKMDDRDGAVGDPRSR